MPGVAIETKNLTKIYNKTKENQVVAIDNVNFTVYDSEFVALMGTSGSGKSTLLHMIGGLDSPTDGEVLVLGHNISEYNDKKLTALRREVFGFVFQKFCLAEELTIRENIIMPVLFDGKKVDDNQINSLCDKLMISDKMNSFPGQLSGGQQQRAAIARALANNPEILLCDEPTGNLDKKTGSEVMELLKKVHKEFGKTILMVTHDEKVASCADRIVYIEDGKITDKSV